MTRVELMALFDQYFQCTCHEAYTGRGLVAPDCWYHDFREFLEDEVAPSLEAP